MKTDDKPSESDRSPTQADRELANDLFRSMTKHGTIKALGWDEKIAAYRAHVLAEAKGPFESDHLYAIDQLTKQLAEASAERERLRDNLDEMKRVHQALLTDCKKAEAEVVMLREEVERLKLRSIRLTLAYREIHRLRKILSAAGIMDVSSSEESEDEGSCPPVTAAVPAADARLTQALATSVAQANEAQRQAEEIVRLRKALERWIPEYDDAEEAGKDEYGDAILKECKSDQLIEDEKLLAPLNAARAAMKGEK